MGSPRGYPGSLVFYGNRSINDETRRRFYKFSVCCKLQFKNKLPSGHVLVTGAISLNSSIQNQTKVF